MRIWIPEHDEWWNDNSLIAHITQQLNHADMNAPSICYPSSPFTRRPYSRQDIVRLCDRQNQFERSVPLCLRFLILTQNRRQMLTCYQMVTHGQASHRLTRNVSQQLCDILQKKLRYQLVNMHDSQGNFIGHWVTRTTPLSNFEVVFRCWDRTRPIVLNQFDEMVSNPVKHFLKTLLQAFPPEQPVIV